MHPFLKRSLGRRRASPAPGELGKLLPLALLAATLLGPGTSPGRADEFDRLRLRWHEFLTGGPGLDLADADVVSRVNSIANNANSRWSSMIKTNDRTCLWADAARTNQSEDITTSYLRLKQMALGWATLGSSVYSNAALAADILDGLEWMYTHRYNETKTKYDNWWDWEIGSAMWLNDCMVLMYPLLSGVHITNYCKAIDKFTPAVTLTGANRIWKADVVAVRGVVEKNGGKVAAARDGLSDVAGGGAKSVFKHVTSGDGFYTDGSFIQHGKHPYTAGYGISHFHDSIKLLHWLEGSPWTVTDPQRTNVLTWCWRSYEPLIYRGAMPAFVRGREIARQSSTGDYSPGRTAINAMLQLAQSAAPSDAARLKSAIKYWDEADTLTSLTSHVPLHLVAAARQLLADTNVPSRGERIGHFQFPCMDRVMHLRPGFAFGISMFSTRIYNYESINTENLKGWYTGDGTTWLYNDDLTQFTDNFWPTIDPYHLPGTTVDTLARANGWGQSKTSSQPWVGGAVLEGSYGAAGMAFKAIDASSSLALNKSWFLFDDEIVCLGAGITCGGTNEVHTTIENRRLNSAGSNGFVADGAAAPATLGWASNYSSLRWCALEWAGGYYFPDGAPVQARRYPRTGRWYDINTLPQPTASVTNPVTRNYFSLILNHGVRPTNATYAYVILPNQDGAAVAAYATHPHIAILENSTQAQAVRETRLNVLAVNFWNAGDKTVDYLTCNNRASVLARETARDLALAVSDPTQTNSGTLTLTLSRSGLTLASADPGITVTRLSPTLQITVNVSGRRGQTLSARFVYDTNRPPVLEAVGTQIAVAGTTFVVTNRASDPDNPPQQLRFELLSAPAGATLDTEQGILTWRPAPGDVGRSNLFTVSVREDGWHARLRPVADAFVRDGSSANLNFGSETNLAVKLAPLGLNRESYLRFDLSGIGGWVTEATVRLHTVAANLPGTHAAAVVTDDSWREESITWNTRPLSDLLLGTWTAQAGRDTLLEVAAGVQAALQIQKPLSLRIFATNTTADGLVNYGSKEGDSNVAPWLEVSAATLNPASATQSFWVVVRAPQAPTLRAPETATFPFQVTVDGDAGLNYAIEAATNLGNGIWTTLLVTNPSRLPFAWADLETNWPRRFYRVSLGP